MKSTVLFMVFLLLGGCCGSVTVRPVFLAYPEAPSFTPITSDDWQAAECQNLDALYRKVAARDIERRQYEGELRAFLDANNEAALKHQEVKQ